MIGLKCCKRIQYQPHNSTRESQWPGLEDFEYELEKERDQVRNPSRQAPSIFVIYRKEALEDLCDGCFWLVPKIPEYRWKMSKHPAVSSCVLHLHVRLVLYCTTYSVWLSSPHKCNRQSDVKETSVSIIIKRNISYDGWFTLVIMCLDALSSTLPSRKPATPRGSTDLSPWEILELPPSRNNDDCLARAGCATRGTLRRQLPALPHDGRSDSTRLPS